MGDSEATSSWSPARFDLLGGRGAEAFLHPSLDLTHGDFKDRAQATESCRVFERRGVLAPSEPMVIPDLADAEISLH